MAKSEYLLGTGGDELARLALQHRLWCDISTQAFRTAGLSMGHRVLDVGCGPCNAARDMAEIVTKTGCVFGIDESQSFVDHANAQAIAQQTPQLEAHVGDVQEIEAVITDIEPFDFAYARWVLCFVSDPEAVIRGIAASLKPGGRLVVQDYFNFRAMTLAPRSANYDKVVHATMQSWHEMGGDPDIGARLPKMFEQHGLRLDDIKAHLRIARGHETMFAWPYTWWHTFAPKLVASGHIEQSDCNAVLKDLEKIKEGHGFIQCPPVYEFFVTKV
jgi:ubiquinone/menaquinone biosynthesis C-methylase UbiE